MLQLKYVNLLKNKTDKILENTSLYHIVHNRIYFPRYEIYANFYGIYPSKSRDLFFILEYMR